MTIRALLLVSCLAGALPAGAQPLLEETYTLDRAIKSAVNNNAALQAAEKDIVIAEQRVQEARLRFLPEIGLQAAASRYNARYPFVLRPEFRSVFLQPSDDPNIFSGQAYMTMPLYEGRRNINTLRLAQTALKQAQSKYEAVKLDVVYNAKEAFYRFLLAQKVLEAARETSAAALDAARRSAGSPWQRLEEEALAAELRSREASAAHELELKRLEFLKGLNIEMDRPVRLEGALETDPVDVDLPKALVWATELRPELQSQTYKAQMDAIGVSLALSRRFPTLVLGMDYELTGQEFPLRQNNWDATIGLRLPFAFDFWTQHTQKVAEQRQAEIRRAELRDQVHLEVRKAHQGVVFWQEEWRRRQEEFRRLDALFAQVVRGDSARTLSAAPRVLQARTRYLEAVAEHILARALLERAVGRTLPALP